MNYRIVVQILLLMSTSGLSAFGNKTLVVPRSQSVDAARELVGWEREINKFCADYYWSLSFAPVYTRSLRNEQIINYLFDGHSQFVFSGSRVPNRGKNDILADYFGLAPDFESSIVFEPRITNFIFDIDWYVGLDRVYKGLYLRVHAPIVYAKWDLHMDECIMNQGTMFYPAGYMGQTQVPNNQLVDSVQQALQGTRNMNGELQPLTFGNMSIPLAYGKIVGRQELTRVSDVQLVAGWNIWADDWYHAGFNIRTSLPSGNVPCGVFLFEPLVGNGGHWEFGVGFTGHVQVWSCRESEQSLSLYCDANLTHLFTVQQRRSFEFQRNGPGSRYMLLEEIRSGSDDLFLGVGGPPSPVQYNGLLIPAINLTTLKANISVPAQLDAVIKIGYVHGSYEFDVGYELWMRSREKLACRDRFAGTFAFKGDAQIYGFTPADLPIALGATEHDATLHGGQGITNFSAGAYYQNLNVDSPVQATSPGTLYQLNTADAATLSIPQLLVQTSNPSIVLTDADIANCSALSPTAITHKLFIHINNRWQEQRYLKECIKVTPFLGIGAFVECAQTGTRQCPGGAFSQWGIIIKGGLSY